MAEVARVEFLVVGSGANGISTAALLKKSGFDDICIITKQADFGGVWLVNRYPGCTTDVAVAAYQLSWAKSYDWTSTHASQAEMLEYLQKVARDSDLYRHARFGTEMLSADWLEEEQAWKVATDKGDYIARFLIISTGFLEEPAVPDLPNRARFKGRLFHSADWPDGYTAEGDRIAVVGTSSSGVQIVPTVMDVASHVYVFQRSSIHILPLNRQYYTPEEIQQRKANPAAVDVEREGIIAHLDKLASGVILGKDPETVALMESIALQHREAQIKDPELLQKMAPQHIMFCKRPTLNDKFYLSLQAPGVELIDEAVADVTDHGIVTASGAEYPVDTVVLATGFRPFGNIATRIHRRDGATVAEHQRGHRMAYKSVSLSGCPNLFMIGGPNGFTWNGFSPGEMVTPYIIRMVTYMNDRSIRALDVDAGAEAAWKAHADEILADAPAVIGHCNTWGLDESGHEQCFWPGSTADMQAEMSEFVPSAYHAVTAKAGLAIQS